MRDRFHHPDDALGKDDHDEYDETTEHELGQIGFAHQPDVERLVDDGADDRAGNRLDAAQEHHYQPIDRERNAEAIGKDAALEIRKQRARDTGNGARNHKGGPLDTLAVDSDRLAAQ